MDMTHSSMERVVIRRSDGLWRKWLKTGIAEVTKGRDMGETAQGESQ